MKVFISWSGPRSRLVAEALHSWLPDVLQNVEPWMSRRDIGAGARWGHELDEQLDATDFGILCVTSENAAEPWLNYEAGALAKRVSSSGVVPYLIGMTSATDLPQGPLSRFQAKVAISETFDVLAAMNAAMTIGRVADDKLRRSFDRWWPDLQFVLSKLPEPEKPSQGPELPDMIREVLETVRELARGRDTPFSEPVTTWFRRTGEEVWAGTRSAAFGTSDTELHDALAADSRIRRKGLIVLRVVRNQTTVCVDVEKGSFRFRVELLAKDVPPGGGEDAVDLVVSVVLEQLLSI